MTDIPAYQIPDGDLGRFGRIAVGCMGGCMGGLLAAVGGVVLTGQLSIAGEVTDPNWFIGTVLRVLAFTALGGL